MSRFFNSQISPKPPGYFYSDKVKKKIKYVRVLGWQGKKRFWKSSSSLTKNWQVGGVSLLLFYFSHKAATTFDRAWPSRACKGDADNGYMIASAKWCHRQFHSSLVVYVGSATKYILRVSRETTLLGPMIACSRACLFLEKFAWKAAIFFNCVCLIDFFSFSSGRLFGREINWAESEILRLSDFFSFLRENSGFLTLQLKNSFARCWVLLKLFSYSFLSLFCRTALSAVSPSLLDFERRVILIFLHHVQIMRLRRSHPYHPPPCTRIRSV